MDPEESAHSFNSLLFSVSRSSAENTAAAPNAFDLWQNYYYTKFSWLAMTNKAMPSRKFLLLKIFATRTLSFALKLTLFLEM